MLNVFEYQFFSLLTFCQVAVHTSECSSSSSSSKKKLPTAANKPSNSLFIVIHVNQVNLGNLKGPATSPVKVYADKFMIQMEDEASNKEISFRVPCKDITSLNVGSNDIEL